jgi:hypothetical protein
MRKRLCYCSLVIVPAVVLILGALWLGTVAGASANGGTRYVAKPPDGDDSSNDCSNPASPCATVQHAVDVANAGDTIKVAGGTYTDTHTVAALGGPVVVELTKAVTLRGGYDTSFSEPPDPEANPTALDAEGSGRVMYISGAGPTIENFIITGGRTTGTGSGAGVYVTNASPTLRGNEIFDNASNHDGGGMWINGGTPLIEGNGIISNTAKWGAGLRIINNSDVTVVGNVIISNVAQLSGGGIELESHIGVTPRVFQNTILYNDGGSRGGGLHVFVADASVVNNLIAHNQSTDGAGVHLESGIPAYPVSATLLHNTCVGNASGDDAVWVEGYVTANLVNNIIAEYHVGITNTTPASGTVSADYTLFHNNGTTYGSDVNSTNEVSGAPEFANPGEGDYHIGPSSGAFDAGVDVGVSVDIEGDRRPGCLAPDVGADEVAPVAYVPLVLKRY